MTFLILICTLPERADKLKRLTTALDKQISKYNGAVSYRCHDAGRSLSTGRKRNMLIEGSQSDYFAFADDDDFVTEEYVDEIMKAIEQGPDVVTFNGWYTEHGANRRNFTIRLGSKYYEDSEDPNFYYYRFPNHLAVFKRSVVQRVKFPDVWIQEDFQWADKIRRMNLLRTEVHIPKMLYHYDCHPVNKVYARRIKIR